MSDATDSEYDQEVDSKGPMWSVNPMTLMPTATPMSDATPISDVTPMSDVTPTTESTLDLRSGQWIFSTMSTATPIGNATPSRVATPTEDNSDSTTSESSDEDYSPEIPRKRKNPPKNPRKRISKKPARYSTSEYTSESDEEISEKSSKNSAKFSVKTRREQNRTADNIADFLFNQLKSKTGTLEWGKKYGEFKVSNQKLLAKMWGDRKGNRNMTYNNVARTMRYHYKKSKKKELEIVNKKLVYRFSDNFLASKL